MSTSLPKKLFFVAFLASSVAFAGAPKKAPALNDPQIATIALTAHQIDAVRGKMAASKTQNPEVKQFAEAMMKDHEAGAKEVLDLAQKLKVKPEESAVTRDLMKQAADHEAQLKKLSGAEFDKAYIDIEVAYHQAVIDAIEKVLLPNVKNAEVKEALKLAQPTLLGHLTHAKNLQAMLAKK